jgi:hypothetical protein
MAIDTGTQLELIRKIATLPRSGGGEWCLDELTSAIASLTRVRDEFHEELHPPTFFGSRHEDCKLCRARRG